MIYKGIQTKSLIAGMVFLSIVSANSILGQNPNYVVSGIVIDNHSNQPLFYANVGLLKVEDSTAVVGGSTDEEGKFKLTNVKSGNYIFQASYIGYEIYRQSLSVTGNNTEIFMDTIRLQPSSATLQGVTVFDKKPVYMSDGEKTLYNVSEDPGIQTGTASDALQNAPGVEVDIEGNISLRGVSSVEIWINDKPSRLEAENLKTYLQQLPANSLERIEVIANPSARYSAQGTGGIINIVTKSNIKKNTFFSFGINGSSKPMASPWISYMYANEKFSFNLYLYGYYYYTKTKSDGYNIVLNENGDTSSYQNYTSLSKSNSISGGLYGYGHYVFDTMNLLSFWAGFYGCPFFRDYSFKDYQFQEIIYNPGSYDYTEESNTSFLNASVFIGISYEHKFNNKGHKVLANAGGSFWKYNLNDPYYRLYRNYSELNMNKKASDEAKVNYMNASIDYTLPYSEKGEIAIGVSGDFLTEFLCHKNDTLLFPSSDSYGLDSMRFEDYVGKRSDMEGYVTVQQRFGQFTVKGGLRFQNRYSDFQVINQPQHHGIKNFPGLFPSIHLSYATKSMHNFTLSYTRRVNNPQNSQLTTFITYYEDSYSTGNGNLRPTYSNSIESGWTKYFVKFGSVGLSAYFRNSKDEIGSLTDVIYDDYFGRYVSFSMPVNSGKSHRYGADANIMYKLKTFMNIRFNAGVYQSHTETVFRENTNVITNDFAYNFQLNFWAKLWNFLEVNASGNYRSKTKSLFFETHPVYSINCGFRSDFFKRKISVFLNVQDIFNWNRQRNNNTNPYYIAYSSIKYNSRFISAGITFRFGKIEMEQQARTGGNME